MSQRGRSFHVNGPKTEKMQEPTVEILVLGIKQSGENGIVCKVEDSHRDKTQQCP